MRVAQQHLRKAFERGEWVAQFASHQPEKPILELFDLLERGHVLNDNQHCLVGLGELQAPCSSAQ